MISAADLVQCYQSMHGRREDAYKRSLGNGLNWRPSFEQFKESETTKHVHRLHPYKGMFTPQLVEYLLDDHTDGVQDNGMLVAWRHHPFEPYCGIGASLVRANE